MGKFSGNSYIRYPGLGDSALLWLSLEVKMKPEKENGLLLYNADRYNQADTGDFLAVVLAGGYVEVVLEDGSGVLVCRGEERLELGVWHSLRVVRQAGQVSLTVDSQEPVTSSQASQVTSHHTLSLQQSLWLGGLQDSISLPSSLGHLASRGLVGCVTSLTINSLPVQLLYSAVATVNLETCQEIARTIQRTTSDHAVPAFSGHSYLAFNSSDIYTK